MWIKTNRIRDHNFWSINASKPTSWTWKAILLLRPLASQFLKARVGNGETVRFWWDNWTPLGPLIQSLGSTGPRDLMIPIESTVRRACDNRGWTIRGARSPAAEALQIYLTTVPLPSLSSELDTYIWFVNEELKDFSTSKTWDAIRPRSSHKPWTSNVWFKGAIPRHAFTMWMAHLDRLPTRSRLVKWGMNVSSSCCLCDSFEETRDHLFMRCQAAEQIWVLVLQRLGYAPLAFHTWNAFSAWLGLKDNTSPLTLRQLVAQATIYKIWAERNNRLHNSCSSPPQPIFKTIDRLVRDAILAKKHRKHFGDLMQPWLAFE